MSALLAALAAAVVAVGAVSTVTARRPRAPLPDVGGYLERWSALHGGHEPRGLTRRWLTGVHRIARPPARAGVTPDAVSLWALVAAYAAYVAAAAGGRWAVLAAVCVGLGGVVDNLDGAVAVLQERVTRFGYVLDSLVDRGADAAYLLALWRLGAPAWACVSAGAALGVLEYARARAVGAGMTDIGLVTVGERPTRVLLGALALLAAGVAPVHAAAASTAGTVATLAVSGVGFGQLVVVIGRRLR